MRLEYVEGRHHLSTHSLGKILNVVSTIGCPPLEKSSGLEWVDRRRHVNPASRPPEGPNFPGMEPPCCCREVGLLTSHSSTSQSSGPRKQNNGSSRFPASSSGRFGESLRARRIVSLLTSRAMVVMDARTLSFGETENSPTGLSSCSSLPIVVG